MASNVSVYFRYSRIAMDENQVIEFKGETLLYQTTQVVW